MSHAPNAALDDEFARYADLDTYQALVRKTDVSGRRGRDGVAYALLGLFGETGSLLDELKKKWREGEAYSDFGESVVDGFGDVLWYLACTAGHAGIALSAVAREVLRDGDADARGFADLQAPQPGIVSPQPTSSYEQQLLRLGVTVGEIVGALQTGAEFTDTPGTRKLLARYLCVLIDAANAATLSLALAAQANARKILDLHPLDRSNRTPLFDTRFEADEQLPRKIEMLFVEKVHGNKRYVVQKWCGVPVGDRLTDNMVEDDGYRFHDAFHLSYAAILGWSPVMRALLRCKRKSDPIVDEVEDGARAIIIEEGVSTWIFNHAIGPRKLFEGLPHLDYALLKAVRKLVKGFEVERCPLWLWERAILEGYNVFRQLRDQHGGIVVADLNERQITFRPRA